MDVLSKVFDILKMICASAAMQERVRATLREERGRKTETGLWRVLAGRRAAGEQAGGRASWVGSGREREFVCVRGLKGREENRRQYPYVKIKC